MIPIYTIAIFAAIIVQAFFTASEMAFTSLNKIKFKDLEDSGDPKAAKLKEFFGEEGAYLGTTLVGTNIAVVVSSALATRIFAEYVAPDIVPVLVTVILVPLTLVFAEIIPKMIARHSSTVFALQSVGPLSFFSRLFHPLVLAVNYAAKSLLKPFKSGPASSEIKFSKTDLKRILLHGQETGEVEEDEVELIHKVLDFSSKSVGSIMVPLYRVSSISIDDSIDTLKKLVSLTGFSRIPIYEKNKNSIAGIINIYDILFEMEEEDPMKSLRDYLRDPIFINKNDGLNIALTRLRHKKQPMGIVIDENENVVGIVTIEDMLEEIVGEIEDIQ